MRKLKIAAAAALVAVLVAPLPAAAQKSADTLRLAFRDSVPNIDPYYNSQRTGLILSHTYQDMLVYREPATLRNQAAAGDGVEARRPPDDRLHAAPGREVS